MNAMYTVVVEARFSAAHRVRMPDGQLEPLHGHEWHVRAHFTRAGLDETGMVVDFCEAESALQTAVEPFDHCDLNEHAALAGLNPTAEIVAKHLFDRIKASGRGSIRRVEVTEAPGCTAIYEP
jgi:6-pyruvoyltetrahydropterin/6-carboxytetrahydropterin synthase